MLSKPLSNLQQRILSGVILAPVILGAVYFGGWVYAGLILLVSALAGWEWAKITSASGQAIVYALACAVPVTLLLYLSYGFAPLAAVLLLGSIIFFIWAKTSGAQRPFALMAGLPYLGLSLAALLWLRDQPDLGPLLFVLFVIWATDIGAYASGRTIGGPKLAPRISPKKTWAGLIGGALCAMLVGWGVAEAFAMSNAFAMALLGGVLAVVGQVGDLLESHLKRQAGVKDSSNLIPGHGGILDRIDGLIAAAPVAVAAYMLF